MRCVLSPLRPSTIKAAKPFVNCESESATIIALSSITSTEIQTFKPSEIFTKLRDYVLTCEVQPGTLGKKCLVTECQLVVNVIYLVSIRDFVLMHFENGQIVELGGYLRKRGELLRQEQKLLIP